MCRVVHWDAPNSLEGYSQESGRAGRDGLPSRAIMYTSRKHFNQVSCTARLYCHHHSGFMPPNARAQHVAFMA